MPTPWHRSGKTMQRVSSGDDAGGLIPAQAMLLCARICNRARSRPHRRAPSKYLRKSFVNVQRLVLHMKSAGCNIYIVFSMYFCSRRAAIHLGKILPNAFSKFIYTHWLVCVCPAVALQHIMWAPCIALMYSTDVSPPTNTRRCNSVNRLAQITQAARRVSASCTRVV